MTEIRTMVSTLWCDIPDCLESREQHGAGNRAEAYEEGWMRRSDTDYCPEHAVAALAEFNRKTTDIKKGTE